MKQFVKIEKNEDHSVPFGYKYLILNRKKDDCMGQIYFKKSWKKWVVEFNHLWVFDTKCLVDITFFMQKLEQDKLESKGLE